jgi:hypothetical protein
VVSPGLNKNGLTVGALDVKYAVWTEQIPGYDPMTMEPVNQSVSHVMPDYRVAFFSGVFTQQPQSPSPPCRRI